MFSVCFYIRLPACGVGFGRPAAEARATGAARAIDQLVASANGLTVHLHDVNQLTSEVLAIELREKIARKEAYFAKGWWLAGSAPRGLHWERISWRLAGSALRGLHWERISWRLAGSAPRGLHWERGDSRGQRRRRVSPNI